MVDALETFLDSKLLIDNRYNCIRRLGVGATGEVVLAEDTHLGDQCVALKFLFPHLLLDENSFSRYRSETLIAMKLAHPNILQTYGMGKHNDGLCYLVMEYVDGQALDEVIGEAEGAPPCFEDTARIAYEVCQGLRHAHSAGIVHRDIKPANILLTKSGLVKVADFGLAQMLRVQGRSDEQGKVLGTPYYMSPEQIRCEFSDARTDIYSFGILIFELATGELPFQAKSFVALAEKHLEEPLPRASEVNRQLPEWFDSFLQRCCAKDRTERFRSMDDVAEHLQANLGNIVNSFTSANSTYRVDDLSRVRASQQMRVQSKYRVQREGRFYKQSFLTVGLLCAVFIGPHISESWRWRYASKILLIENHLGLDLSYVKRIFGINLDLNDTHYFFGGGGKPMLWPLLEAGVSPNFYNEELGKYPIHFWAYEQATKYVEKLLEHGADPNPRDLTGKTALLIAVDRNVYPMVTTLLEAGADPDMADLKEINPLHRAIQRESNLVLQTLLQYGANPNSRDSEGNTPAHYAACRGNEAALRLLKRKGADFSLLDESGKTVDELLQANRLVKKL